MDYEAILRQQVADQRSSQVITPSSSSSIVKKQVFIPLEEPSSQYVDTEVNTAPVVQNTTVDVKKSSKDFINEHSVKRTEISVQAATEAKGKSGGKIGDSSQVNAKKTAPSDLNINTEGVKSDPNSPSLFSLCMAPQPEPPKRSLYTYFDLLQNNGKL